MPSPSRRRESAGYPDLERMLTDDGSWTLVDRTLDESFHSGSGAVAESLWVYVQNSGVLRRLRQGIRTRVFEMGLGTGTALVLTAAAAECWGTELFYSAAERRLLPWWLVERLNPAETCRQLLDTGFLPDHRLPPHYPEAVARIHAQFVRRLQEYQSARSDPTDRTNSALPEDAAPAVRVVTWRLTPTTTARVVVGDACSMEETRWMAGQPIDCIYFDAFSPDKTPGLWIPEVFVKMRAMLVPTGVLTTYCVRRSVRQRMQRAGFRPHVVEGPPGGKRQVLRATVDP